MTTRPLEEEAEAGVAAAAVVAIGRVIARAPPAMAMMIAETHFLV